MTVLEKIQRREQPAKAALYARFSSKNQRDESIDAQVRAINEFAAAHNIIIIKKYVDKARSATTDDRPAFQQMIKDSDSKQFELVLVHKLDRFARNRNDSSINKYRLRKNGVMLISVLEPFDESRPETIILESVIEGYAEFYSKNLAREVRKGLKENALKCLHTGGYAPFGYDVDPVTKKLVINKREAYGVKMIYTMLIQGSGYNAIMVALKENGYKTKAGNDFGKNSLYEILRNPKYKGLYIYNKVSAADPFTKKRNSHKFNDKEDMIIIPNGIPAIISPDEFGKVQAILTSRKRHKNSKIERYLLTGKIFCGVCGATYTGNRKKSTGNRKPIVTYRCNNRARRTSIACSNKEVNRNYLETFVMKKIEDAVFDKKMVNVIFDGFKEYVKKMSEEKNGTIHYFTKRVKQMENEENNLTDIIAKGIANTIQQKVLLDKIDSIEQNKQDAIKQLEVEKATLAIQLPDKRIISNCFQKARKMFRNGTLEETQQIIDMYVDKVIVYPEEIQVVLNLIPFYATKQDIGQQVYTMLRELDDRSYEI